MRYLSIALLLTIALAALAACEENPGKKIGRALVQPIEKSRAVAAVASLSAMRTSINAYQASNGVYPLDLEELSAAMGLDPEDYEYDPATGRVSLR